MNKLSTLSKQIENQIQQVPRLLLRNALEKKLQEHGLQDDTLLDDFTDHILSNCDSSFYWDGGKYRPENSVLVEFSQKESDELLEALRKFRKEGIPEIIQIVIRDGAKTLVRGLEKQWPEVKVDELNEMRHFRDRLELRWAKGLDPLRMMLTISRELGEAFAEKIGRSKAKKNKVKRQCIMFLHTRACQTAMEIITLLENGLPDGAYARWRTLYEISVVAFVIDRFGDDIAERYLAHEVVGSRESLVNEFKYDGRTYDPEQLDAESREIEEDFQYVIAKFGKPFASPYGWAADSLSLKKPTFQDLERAVDWSALPPNYKWSSYKVHAGVVGTVRTLSMIGNMPFVHSGASNAGLEVPAINTAFSLMHVTSLVFDKLSVIDTPIQMQSLVILRDKVMNECKKISKKLEKEELEFLNEVVS